MAVEYNASVVTSGLLANYDFGNRKSFVPSQNLISYSEQFNNGFWSPQSGITISADSLVSPIGTLTADTLIGNGSTVGYLAPAFTYTTGATYTFSCYMKAGTQSSALILLYGTNFNNAGANITGTFNLSAGTFTSNATGSGMISVGNGWYRCWITQTCTSGGVSGQQLIRLASATGTIYAWGYQLELNSSMTDYVATTTTGATRSTNIIDTVGGYNMSNSYGNNAIYINTTSNYMQFSRASAAPKDGGGASVTMSGSLTAANFLYNDFTWEVWFRIDDRNPGNTIWTGDATEGLSCLANYAGWHQGFQYTASSMNFAVVDFSGSGTYYNGATWTLGTSGTQIIQGNWYQIAVTKASNVYTPYLNGVQFGTGATIASMLPTNLGTGNTVWIGKVNNAAAGASSYLYYSKNSVSNMKMYNRALSAAEININFQALRGRFGI